MPRHRLRNLALGAVVAVLAACSGGTPQGGGRARGGAGSTTPSATVAPSQLPRMVLDDGPRAASARSDDPHVSQASSTDDYIARLRELQRAIFPDLASPPTHQTGVTTRGVTDDAVRVGIVSTLSGPAGSLDACRGALARLERTGAHHTVDAYQEYVVERYGGQTLPYAYDPSGTVNGRELQIVGVGSGDGLPCRDDGGDPARAAAQLDDLVDGHQVFAVLTPGANAVTATGSLDERHVPYVGYGASAAYCGTASVYGTPAPSAAVCDASIDRLVIGDIALPAYLAATGPAGPGLRVAVFGSGADPAAAEEVHVQVERAGGTVVVEPAAVPASGSSSVSAVTDWVESVQAATPDLVVLLGPQDADGIEPELRRAGFTGDVLALEQPDGSSPSATAFRVVRADGRTDRFDSVLAPSTDGPAVSLIRADLDAAGLTDVPLTAAVVSGWATADLFVDALTRTPEPLTAEAFANFLNGGSYAYAGVDGLVCPQVLPLTRVAPTPCGALSPSSDLRYYDLFLAAR